MSNPRDGGGAGHLAQLDCQRDTPRAPEPAIDFELNGGGFRRRIVVRDTVHVAVPVPSPIPEVVDSIKT